MSLSDSITGGRSILLHCPYCYTKVALLAKADFIYSETFTANESTIPRECVSLITTILSAYSNQCSHCSYHCFNPLIAAKSVLKPNHHTNCCRKINYSVRMRIAEARFPAIWDSFDWDRSSSSHKRAGTRTQKTASCSRSNLREHPAFSALASPAKNNLR